MFNCRGTGKSQSTDYGIKLISEKIFLFLKIKFCDFLNWDEKIKIVNN